MAIKSVWITMKEGDAVVVGHYYKDWDGDMFLVKHIDKHREDIGYDPIVVEYGRDSYIPGVKAAYTLGAHIASGRIQEYCGKRHVPRGF